jgi:uncharacterized protein (UPF0276 family)
VTGHRRPHLAQWRELIGRVQPVLVSEHLAWSAWQGACLPDLLPLVRTRHSLQRISANIGRAQDVLGRSLAIENPSHYLHLEGHEFSEMDFLDELARRTGCGLLVDVNNVFVSAVNLGLDAGALIDAFPAALVREVHLAGHSADPIHGECLLIDSHDAPVSEAVLALYRRLVRRIGARPTLIERDARLPPFADLMAECDRAAACGRVGGTDPQPSIAGQCPSGCPRERLPARFRPRPLRSGRRLSAGQPAWFPGLSQYRDRRLGGRPAGQLSDRLPVVGPAVCGAATSSGIRRAAGPFRGRTFADFLAASSPLPPPGWPISPAPIACTWRRFSRPTKRRCRPLEWPACSRTSLPVHG